MSKYNFIFGSFKKGEKPKQKLIRICINTDILGFEFLDNKLYNDLKQKGYKIQLDILDDLFTKWLDTFPFEFPLFDSTKEIFEKKPYLVGNTKTKGFRLCNKIELANILLSISNSFFKQVNASVLCNSGHIEDYEKHIVDVILKKRNIEANRGFPIKNNDVFVDCTLDWLNKESETWEKLLPFINKPVLTQLIVESPFSVLEWATIFYYAEETNLLPESRLIKTRLEQFMNKHKINTTFDNFKTKYYEAKKRINEKKDYPISKLELIIPFLKENYKQTVAKVENDIFFLEENKPEY
jgi:hypothetical protein